MTNKEEALEQSQAMNQLLLEMVKTQKTNTKSLIRVFIATIICYTMLLIAMTIGFFLYESQFEATEEIVTTETTTQEVSENGSEINNVEGNLYKDNATHNEERGVE